MNGKLLKLGLPNMDSQRWYHDIRSGVLVCFHVQVESGLKSENLVAPLGK